MPLGLADRNSQQPHSVMPRAFKNVISVDYACLCLPFFSVVTGFPDAFCKNTGHFVISARSKLSRNS